MTVELLARTSAILLAGTMLAALLRHAAPATRHLVLHCSIVIVLLAPVLIALAPALPGPIVPGMPDVPAGIVLNAVAISIQPVSETGAIGTQPHVALGALGTIGTAGSVLIGSWFLCCWLLSGVSVWRGSKPAPEVWLTEARAIARWLGMKHSIQVRQSLRDGSPHVAGAFQSVVMMPPSALSWAIEARQAALVHELTHIRRHDRRTQAIAQLACAIYWFNPLVWHAAAGLARERERACDDEVLRFGAKPSAYAALLLDLARTANSAWTPATALSMARPSAVEGRVLSILADAVRTPRRSTRWLVGCAIATITTAILGARTATPPDASVALAMVRPQAVMALDEQEPTPSTTGALVEALRDVDGQVREQAAMGLAITPGTDVIEPLLGALKDPDPQVREKAAIGLAFRRDPKIVDALLIAIDDSDGQVREKAAIALGASGDGRALPALTGALKDPDSQVREKAVAALLMLGLRPSPPLRADPRIVEGGK